MERPGSVSSPSLKDVGTMKTSTSTFARRARLSTYAIATAVAVTLAAFVALLLAGSDQKLSDLKIEGPADMSAR